MLTCRELAQQQASDYLDNHLTLRQRLGVKLHLLLCHHCRRFIKQFKQVRRVLAHQPAPVDEATVQQLAERLHHLHQDKK